ncbi:MAG: TolC family protein [Fusobacteriaceae bacterium]
MIRLLKIVLIIIIITGCSNSSYEKIRKTSNENLDLKREETKKILDLKNGVLTLKESLEIAYANSSNLKIKNLEREIATLDKKTSFGNFLPKINASLGYSSFDNGIYGQGVDTPLPIKLDSRLMDKEVRSAGISGNIPIFVPSTWFLYSAKKKGEDISKQLVELEKKVLTLEVTANYYEILFLEYEKIYLEKQLEYSNKSGKNAKVALKTESILPFEYEEALLFIKVKELALKNNAKDLKLSRMRFLNILNLYPSLDFKILDVKENKNTPESLDEAVYLALENNDLLKIGDMKEAISQDKKKIAIANFLPKIVLSGGYQYSDNTALVDPNFAFLSVNGLFSVFNGFENINFYKKTKLEREIIKLENEELVIKTILETVNSYETLKNAQDQLKIAEENYRIQNIKYENKKLELTTEYIDEVEFLKYLSIKEEAFSKLKKSEYYVEVSKAMLEIILGGKQ